MKRDLQFRRHIGRAITKCGSQAALADKTKLSQSGISWLLNEATQVSAEIAVKIEEATDGEVQRWQLRPDLFAPPSIGLGGR